jgi:subtilisin family serine protease
MRKASVSILVVTVFLLAGLSVNGAVIHESLQMRLDEMGSGETVDAIVFFKHQADIQSLNKQLKMERATLTERHYQVVTALQEAATLTQPSATAFLEQIKTQGLVTDYSFYWIVNAFHVTAYPEGIRALAERQELDILYLDFPVELIEPVKTEEGGGMLLGHEVGLDRINAPAAWEQGWTGLGRVVMNIDTGVDGSHPALADRFRGDVDGDEDVDESWYDPYDTHWQFPQDGGSHGTHTMGTICGRTAGGDTIGVAIDAQWIAAAAVDRGGGIPRTIADILLSFQWAADPDSNPGTPDNPDAIGNSWGIPDGIGYPDCDETFWQVIDNVEAVGSVVIFSAGNEGSSGLRSPADRAETLYNVFSVGAVNGNDPNMPIASFSARGPTECARDEPLNIKPEVVAPGVSVRSSVPGNGYDYYSGTSMSSPHVTGSVAVIRQVNPDLDVETIKDILIATSHEVPADGQEGEDNTYGNGIIDLYEACLTAQTGYGFLQGTVADSANVGIDGARIQIIDSPRFTLADENGFYSIGLRGDTTYTVEASAYGYLPEEAEAFVAPEETTTVDFILPPAPSPDIEVDPASFHVTSEQGQSTVRNLVISNVGEVDLTFEILPRTENRRLDGGQPDLPLTSDAADAPGKSFLGYQGDREFRRTTYTGPKTETPEGPANPPMTLDRGGPDGYGYTWVDSDEPDGPEFQWIDISRDGQELFFTDDDNQGPFDLGFTMPFYDNFFSSVYICSNGWLSFTSTAADYTNDPIPNSADPNDLVAPFWDDLNPSQGGSVYFYSNGADSFIVMWYQVPHFYNDGSYTFEVILTASGDIQYQYQALQGDLASNTIGIENSDGTIGLQVAYNQGYAVDGLAVLITIPLMWLDADPLSGLIMPNSSADIDVIFDATELEVDTYTGYLEILSNDPHQQTLIVPCTLTVTPQTSVDDDTEAIPREFGLDQNYPNPFNPSTRIGFALPEQSEVNLVIYDLLGRQVRNLYSGELQAGYQLVAWDGTNDEGDSMPSGVYFYRLQAGDLQQSRKMLMIK